MLDPAAAVAHLAARGLLSASELGADPPAAHRIPGRNLLFRIDRRDAAPLLLKRAVDEETRRGLEREARAYDRITSCADPALVRGVPSKRDYEPESATLVLDFCQGFRSLAPVRNGWSRLKAPVASALGHLIARYHDLPAPTANAAPPWILELVHPPVGILREATRSQLELLGNIQRSSTWRRSLTRLAEKFESRSLVHGDLRFSNVLVEDVSGVRGEPHLQLIDWELAGPGDPGQDTGRVVAEILANSLRDPRESFPLLRAFWGGYVDEPRRLPTHARLDSTLSWAAAASLQIAYESAGPSLTEVPPARMLDIGRSMVERPQVWIERVFSPDAE